MNVLFAYRWSNLEKVETKGYHYRKNDMGCFFVLPFHKARKRARMKKESGGFYRIICAAVIATTIAAK